jgi:hypothetical protein
VVEWRAYAEFLEEQGALIAQRLRHARSDLRVARNSLRRAKGAKITPTETLLTAKAKQKGKPGRPPSGKTESDANEVLALQAELQQTQGKTVSVRGAIKEHFIRNGRVYHPDHVRNLENVVSKVRVKFHKNRSR